MADDTNAPALRLGAVSYLNTLPVIEGLGKLEGVRLTLTPPSELAPLLEAGEVDVALCSSVDYTRARAPLSVLPAAGCIACDGPTMTVRLFSSVPIDAITTVATDVDSHTSATLLDVLLRERWGRRATFEPFDAEAHRALIDAATPGSTRQPNWPEAILLIGDKVVTASPPAIHYPHQLDLGEAWHELTGLPFVYAAWMCATDRADDPLIARAAVTLDRQRRRNTARLGWIAEQRGGVRGWPTDLALKYLSELLKYEFEARTESGLKRFFELAHAHELVPGPPELRLATPALPAEPAAT
ncbi:MAG: menaquinone biosynthesis protein [Planctomycetota bacterium]